MYRYYIPLDYYVRAGRKIRKFAYNVMHQKEAIDDSVDRAEDKARRIIQEAETAAFDILETAERRTNRVFISGMFRVILTGLLLISAIFFTALGYNWLVH